MHELFQKKLVDTQIRGFESSNLVVLFDSGIYKEVTKANHRCFVHRIVKCVVLLHTLTANTQDKDLYWFRQLPYVQCGWSARVPCV